MNSYKLAYRVLSVEDESLGIAFPVHLFYPSYSDTEPKAFGPFVMEVAMNGDPAGSDLPLFILSHGSGASPLAYRTYGTSLAQMGAVVAIPEHPFNHRFDNSWEGRLENLLHRPRHIRLLADVLYSHPLIGGIIKDRISLIGHSIGAYSAMVAAGAKASTKPVIDFCQQEKYKDSALCKLIQKTALPEVDIPHVKDPRVKQLILMDPGTIFFAHKGSLNELDAKMLIYTAEKEEGMAEGIALLSQYHPKPELIQHIKVINSTHYSFLSPFPDTIRQKVGMAGSDHPDFNREAFHQKLYTQIMAFAEKGS